MFTRIRQERVYRAKSIYDLMRILSKLVFIPQTQESIGGCMTFPDFGFFFIEQLFLIFNQIKSIRALDRRDVGDLLVPVI